MTAVHVEIEIVNFLKFTPIFIQFFIDRTCNVIV